MSSKLIWFHHLHKCAGTLVVQSARRAGLAMWPGERNGNPHDERGLVPIHDYSAERLREFIDESLDRGVQFVATEFGAPDFDVLRAHPAVRTVTVLRDPYPRFRSSYLFCVDCGYTKRRTMASFYNAEEIDSVTNYYTRTFARLDTPPDAAGEAEAARVLRDFDLVLVQEQPGLADRIAEFVGAAEPIARRVNAGQGRNWRMLLGRARRGELAVFMAGLTARRAPDNAFEARYRAENEADYRLYELAASLSHGAVHV